MEKKLHFFHNDITKVCELTRFIHSHAFFAQNFIINKISIHSSQIFANNS